MTTTTTTAYIAKPRDSRCKYWAIRVPADAVLGVRILSPFLRVGADLELSDGDFLIQSEANHHTKNRGYCVQLVGAVGGTIVHMDPTAATKKYIKENGGAGLMGGTGEVDACLRVALWLRSQPDLAAAWGALPV